MLEAGRVGRVTRDGYVYVLVPHDGYTFAYVVCTVAFYFGAGTVGVRSFLHNLQFACVVVKLSLNVCKAVDTGDDHGGVLAQTIQDAAQGVLAYLVGHFGDLDGTFGGCERLVAGQEGEALSLFAEQTGCQVTVAQTYLAVVGY